MKSQTKKAAVIIALIIAAFFVLYCYKTYNPTETFFPRCPFFWLTGLKCPGCGSQRAIHQLLNFDIAAAFRYNACLVLFIPVLVFLLLAELLRDRYPGFYSVSHHPALSWTLVGVIVLWWLVRNLFGW